MPVYKKHYTREEARALLPRIREWLALLSELREKVLLLDEKVSSAIGLGDDLGGPIVNQQVRALAAMKEVLLQFQSRDIQVKDLDRGLVDFPAFIGGKEVFLCWEKDEEDIEYWHDLQSGYAGREKI